jgi:phosphinothricin acetyltransferase
MEIRPAETRDLAALVEIYNQAVRVRATADLEPVTEEQRRGWFEAHPPDRRPILVAEQDGQVIGWAGLSDYRPGRQALRHTAEISYFVDERHRRQGVANALVRSCIERCPLLEIRSLFAILLENNEPSIRLLEGLGFERWAHLPRIADFEGEEIGQLYYGRRI